MACNTAECYMLAVFGMARGDLWEALRKLPDVCKRNVTSKIVTLAIPLGDYGTSDNCQSISCNLRAESRVG